MKFKTHIEVEVEIEYNPQEAEPMSYWHPGYPADAEDITVKLMTDLDEVAAGDDVKLLCLEHMDDLRAEKEIERADHRMDLFRNR